jgi:hypothetical protein
VEAFKDAAQYGLRYTRMISDADTCTYSSVKKAMHYGVEKADCVEHTIRTLERHLYNNVIFEI